MATLDLIHLLQGARKFLLHELLATAYASALFWNFLFQGI